MMAVDECELGTLQCGAGECCWKSVGPIMWQVKKCYIDIDIDICEILNFNLCSLNTSLTLVIACDEYKMLNCTNLYTKLQNGPSKYRGVV